MNQQWSETRQSSMLSDVLNPNYKDPSLAGGSASPPSLLDDLTPLARVPEGPEYLNATQSSYPLDTSNSMDYQATFLPQATPSPTDTATSAGSRLFLPAAENPEYLGVGAAPQAPVH